MDLPNIVQERGGFNLLDLHCRKTHLDGDRPRQFTDAQRMTRRVRIACFDSLYHYLKKLLPAFLQLMIEAVNVPDCDHWNYYTKQANWPEAETVLGLHVQPSH